MSIKPTPPNCSSLPSDHKVSRLFVTGLSKDTSLQSILSYFSTFGYVQARLLRKDGGKPGATYGSCCLVTAGSQAVSQYILAHPEHYLEGRLLHVSVFLEGEALQAHNDKINKRRVVVKGVPATLLLDVLRQSLEARFGKTESVYFFKQSPTARSHRGSGCSARPLTASVVFCSSQSARQAASAGKVPVAGHLVAVQEFQRGFNKSNTFSANTEPTSDGSVRSRNDPSDHPSSQLSERGGRLPAPPSRQPPRKFSGNTADACGDQLSVLHSMKPSSSAYFRHRLPDRLSTTGSKGRADNNYKFNFARQK